MIWPFKSRIAPDGGAAFCAKTLPGPTTAVDPRISPARAKSQERCKAFPNDSATTDDVRSTHYCQKTDMEATVNIASLLRWFWTLRQGAGLSHDPAGAIPA